MIISVVIPTYNDPAHLRACVESLCISNYPAADFEVIIVNDGSRDATRRVMAELAGRFGHAQPLADSQENAEMAQGHGLLLLDS